MHLFEEALKKCVREHWERETCGERYAVGTGKEYYGAVDERRYELDWMIPSFAKFESYRGKQVLEVGLGTGADFVRWVRAGAVAHGRDITKASVEHVKARLLIEGLQADVQEGDAEDLNLPDNSVDLFYSWGVLHHTPNMEKAIAEAYRVLKPGGELKIMIYHSRSVLAFLLWIIHGWYRLKSIRRTAFDHLESPGTKICSVAEARRLVCRYQNASIRTWLSAGDLLLIDRSRRYKSVLWTICSGLYPRTLIRLLGHRVGLCLTIHAYK